MDWGKFGKREREGREDEGTYDAASGNEFIGKLRELGGGTGDESYFKA